MVAYLIVSAGLLMYGMSASATLLSILQAALIMGALAISFQIIYGFLGELSLGHAALFGSGAYAYSWAVLHNHNPYASLAFGAVVGGLIGCIVALITIRMGGVYFAVVTFALSGIMAAIVSGTGSLGSTDGLVGVSSLHGPEKLMRSQWQFLIVGTAFVFFLLFIMQARKTRFGATLEMARSNRWLATSQGINVSALRIVVTSISGVLAGTAGGLMAQNARFISPDAFHLYYIITPLAVVAVGGMRHVFGVIPGLLIVVVVPRFLGLSPILNQVLAAALLAASIMLFPRGIAGALETLFSRVRKGRNKSMSEANMGAPQAERVVR